MRVPLEGGTAEKLPLKHVEGSATFSLSDVSRDDAMLTTPVSIAEAAKGTYRKGFAILKTNALGIAPQVFDADPRVTSSHSRAPMFTPDGLAVVYPIGGEANVDNLWLQPLDSKVGHQISQFSSDQIFAICWSPDAKQLLVGRGHVESDVVLLRDSSK